MFHRVTLVFALLALFSGCGDGTSTTPTPPPPPPPPPTPSMANIEVEINNPQAFASGMGNLFTFDLTMRETAGLGANINFARLAVFRATGELEEIQEIGADQIIQGAGDNRLEGSTTETVGVTFFFRATIKVGRQMELTVGFTDDKGNDIDVVQRFVFVRS
ncbi:MAG TPA: hypothetical protein VLK65_18285 [Vicinamibacteria bacterium]|nr:hypothetical protein [Vicinamibacteria bacterium]